MEPFLPQFSPNQADTRLPIVYTHSKLVSEWLLSKSGGLKADGTISYLRSREVSSGHTATTSRDCTNSTTLSKAMATP